MKLTKLSSKKGKKLGCWFYHLQYGPLNIREENRIKINKTKNLNILKCKLKPHRGRSSA